LAFMLPCLHTPFGSFFTFYFQRSISVMCFANFQ
jgi:hypothetical protein